MASLNNALEQQRLERDRLLAASYVPREQLRAAQRSTDAQLIKVIIGPRRAGKSVFALQLLKGRDFGYVNFDDETLETGDTNRLLEALAAVYGDTRLFLFDEIQNLPRWEPFVSRLQRRGYNLVLTGSNARLLSRELATSLTGRHLPIEILPFTFREYLAARQFAWDASRPASPEAQGQLLRHLAEYVSVGGYPEVVVQGLDPAAYLGTLVDAVLFKDVVRRYQVRFPRQLSDLALYLLSNATAAVSATRLQRGLGFRSVHTVMNYLGYLEQTFLFFLLQRYSARAVERMTAPRKAYVVDNGLITAKGIRFSPDRGRLLENLVFIELVKRGAAPNRDLFSYQTRNQREVDFVLRAGPSTTALVQAAYAVEDAATRRREVRALLEASEELRCDTLLVVTWETAAEERLHGKTITFVPLWQWLVG